MKIERRLWPSSLKKMDMDVRKKNEKGDGFENVNLIFFFGREGDPSIPMVLNLNESS